MVTIVGAIASFMIVAILFAVVFHRRIRVAYLMWREAKVMWSAFEQTLRDEVLRDKARKDVERRRKRRDGD